MDQLEGFLLFLKKAEERPLVAAVYSNRLRIRMPLH